MNAGACADGLTKLSDSIPNALGFKTTEIPPAPAAGISVVSNLLCSIKVIIINIPVRSAGGGLHDKTPKPH